MKSEREPNTSEGPYPERSLSSEELKTSNEIQLALFKRRFRKTHKKNENISEISPADFSKFSEKNGYWVRSILNEDDGLTEHWRRGEHESVLNTIEERIKVLSAH